MKSTGGCIVLGVHGTWLRTTNVVSAIECHSIKARDFNTVCVETHWIEGNYSTEVCLSKTQNFQLLQGWSFITEPAL